MRATRQVRRRCAQVAGYLARNSPLSAFVTEVVCDVGGAAPRRDLTTPNRDLTAPNRGLTAIKWGGVALHGDPCVTCLPMTAPSNGGSCASRGPVRDVPADDIATKRGELHH